MSEQDMAAVLERHQIVYENDGGDYGGRSWFECSCEAADVIGAEVFATEADHRAHVAQALAAAGFGALASAKAEALREAADEMDSASGGPVYAAHWLRERAAQIEPTP